MKIGITGAGGQIGMVLVGYAVGRASGSDIVGITRTPAKLEKFAKLGVEVRTGDFNQPASLDAAFRGVQRLVIIPTADLTLGVRTRQQTDAI